MLRDAKIFDEFWWYVSFWRAQQPPRLPRGYQDLKFCSKLAFLVHIIEDARSRCSTLLSLNWRLRFLTAAASFGIVDSDWQCIARQGESEGTILRGHDETKKELHSVTHFCGHLLKGIFACNSASWIGALVVRRRGVQYSVQKRSKKHIHISSYFVNLVPLNSLKLATTGLRESQPLFRTLPGMTKSQELMHVMLQLATNILVHRGIVHAMQLLVVWQCKQKRRKRNRTRNWLQKNI